MVNSCSSSSPSVSGAESFSFWQENRVTAAAAINIKRFAVLFITIASKGQLITESGSRTGRAWVTGRCLKDIALQIQLNHAAKGLCVGGTHNLKYFYFL